MSRHLLVLVLVVGVGSLGACSKKRVAECDDFVKTAEKLGACDKLPAAQRSTMSASAKQIKDMLKTIDDAGGFDQAPKELVDEMRQTCKSQNERLVEEINKAFPDCLK